VAGVVARDLGMSAKVVQLVSSGFFGSPQRVSSAAHAAKLLGLETLRAMVESSWAFRPCCANGWEESLPLLAAHSLAVAEAADGIARTLTGDRTLVGGAYLAGFLHEIGSLALTGCNASCGRVADTAGIANAPDHETRTNKGDPDPGAYLAALWGLPDPVVQAIAYHRSPGSCPDQPAVPLTAVHVAHALCERSDNAADEAAGLLDVAYLRASGCAEQMGGWREKCRDPQAGAPQPAGGLQ
jgi:HD-like signal output (HDOD) protein